MLLDRPVSSPLDREVQFAVQAMQSAFEILEAIGPESAARPVFKEDRTPVTIADFAIQAAVVGLLERVLPRDRLVGEEDDQILRSARGGPLIAQALVGVRRVHPETDEAQLLEWLRPAEGPPSSRSWVLDPIDGTIGLIRGRQYVTALALIEDGRVLLGAMACPRYARFGEAGCISLAIRDHGAWASGWRDPQWNALRRASTADGRRPRLIRSVEAGWRSRRRLTTIRKRLGMDRTEVRMDGQVKYLALAAGDGDLMVRLPRLDGARKENVWDHAAGTILVEEAGGRTSDVRGQSLDFGRGWQLEGNLGVVASAGDLHARAIEAIEPVLSDQERRR